MEGLMDSPGHRSAILDPWARKVNIGIEWGHYNFTAVQQFEGDYVEYARLPAIEGNILIITGKVKNGISFAGDDSLGVIVFYDPPPQKLTRGQVARTYCYDAGIPIANLRKPPPQGRYYLDDEFNETVEFCPDPRDVSSDAQPPESYEEAGKLWQEARDANQRGIEQTVPVMHITASRWMVWQTTFSVRADISDLTNRYGPGVYTVVIVTESGKEDVMLSQYSIFYETPPPG